MTRPAKSSERIAVIHADEEATTELKVVHLPRKSGTDLLLAVCGKSLLELASFNPSHAAWMAGNKLIPDGALHTMTPVDPLLFVLPQFPTCTKELEELFNQKLSEQHQFLLDIVAVEQMVNVCDTKNMGGDIYYRFSFERICAWLACKVFNTVESLKDTCQSALPPGPQSERRYAVGLLSEYLSPDWAEHLVNALGLQDVPVVSQKRVLSEVQIQGVPPPVSEQQKEADLSTKDKAAQSREASKLKARAKAAKGSAAISSFFGGKK